MLWLGSILLIYLVSEILCRFIFEICLYRPVIILFTYVEGSYDFSTSFNIYGFNFLLIVCCWFKSQIIVQNSTNCRVYRILLFYVWLGVTFYQALELFLKYVLVSVCSKLAVFYTNFYKLSRIVSEYCFNTIFNIQEWK